MCVYLKCFTVEKKLFKRRISQERYYSNHHVSLFTLLIVEKMHVYPVRHLFVTKTHISPSVDIECAKLGGDIVIFQYRRTLGRADYYRAIGL